MSISRDKGLINPTGKVTRDFLAFFSVITCASHSAAVGLFSVFFSSHFRYKINVK